MNSTTTATAGRPRFDPQRYKTTTTEQWQAAAAAWYAWGPVIDTWLGEATDVMLDLAGVTDGSKVLDVTGRRSRPAGRSPLLAGSVPRAGCWRRASRRTSSTTPTTPLAWQG